MTNTKLEQLGAALKPSQRLFADTYARTGHAEQSALAAGYAASSARNTGPRLLRHPDVIAYLAALAEATASTRIADLTELREFWTGTMRDGEQDMGARLKASEMLGKSFGAFIERRELSGGGSIDVQITRRIVTGDQ